MQYIIPDIPEEIDDALKRRARREGKSLVEVAVAALREGAGVAQPANKRRNLQDIVGSWAADPETDEALAEQRLVDPAAWR